MQAGAPPGVGELIAAVDAGDIDRVRELLSGGSIDVNAEVAGWTALQSAAAEGSLAITSGEMLNLIFSASDRSVVCCIGLCPNL